MKIPWSSLLYNWFVWTMPRDREQDFFKKYINFTLFTQKFSSGGGGSWNLQFLVSFPYICYIPNLVKIGPLVSEEKMLTDNRRRTTTDANPKSPGWLRWPRKINVFCWYLCLENGVALQLNILYSASYKVAMRGSFKKYVDNVAVRRRKFLKKSNLTF